VVTTSELLGVGIAALLRPTVNLTVSAGGSGADVGPLANKGVPAAGLSVSEYYHSMFEQGTH
jgi:hypothetical protein